VLTNDIIIRATAYRTSGRALGSSDGIVFPRAGKTPRCGVLVPSGQTREGIIRRRRSGRTLYTIGHSTRGADELIDILHAFGVTRLVDIRSTPWSRTNPQFNHDALPATLRVAGIAYIHLATLGGRRIKTKRVEDSVNAGWERRPFHNYADYAESAPFREGLRALLDAASRETCAIMCAETLWWRCHRRIVTDHVLAHGVPVVHLFSRTKGEAASLTPFAVIGAGGRVSYPESAPSDLGTKT
jgi:hypothetical protein